MTSQPYLRAGDCEGTDLKPVSGTSACTYTKSQTGSDGQLWWYWRFVWWNHHGPTGCSAWGPDAKLIFEVDQPTATTDMSHGLPICTTEDLSADSGAPCAMANAWRFEIACSAGEHLFQLPSEMLFHGYYHIESSQYPTSARQPVLQDIHCGRDLYPPGGLVLPPVGVPDGGVPTDSSIPASPNTPETAAVDTSPAF